MAGLPDFDLNDILGWGKDQLSSFFGSSRMGNLVEQITAMFVFSQLTQAFHIGEKETEIAREQEAQVLSSINSLAAEMGQLYESYKSQYTDLGTLSRAAQATYERSMGKIRQEAAGLKNANLYKMASMGLGRSEISASSRAVDRAVLEQSAVAHQNAETYNEELRARMETNMSNIIAAQRGLSQDKMEIAKLHYEMGQADEQRIADIITSLVSQYYYKAPVTNVNAQSGTTTVSPNAAGGNVFGGGGTISGGADAGGAAGGAIGQETRGGEGQGPSRVSQRPVQSVVIDSDGRVSIGEYAGANQSTIAGAGNTPGNAGNIANPAYNPTGANVGGISIADDIANTVSPPETKSVSRPAYKYEFDPVKGRYVKKTVTA